MPKKLVMDIYSGYKEMVNFETEAANDATGQAQNEVQPADAAVAPEAEAGAEAGATV